MPKRLSEFILARMIATGDTSPGMINYTADVLELAVHEADRWANRPDDAQRIPDVLAEAARELRAKAASEVKVDTDSLERNCIVDEGFDLPSSISIDQLLGIWDELTQAYYGRNGYGGDTAEIYGYRLVPFNPKILHDTFNRETRRTQGINAKNALWMICKRFQQQWNCKCVVEGLSLWDWFQLNFVLDHRAHVQVIALDDSEVDTDSET